MHMRPLSQVSQYFVPSPQGGVSPASTLTPKVGQAKLEQNMGDISLWTHARVVHQAYYTYIYIYTVYLISNMHAEKCFYKKVFICFHLFFHMCDLPFPWSIFCIVYCFCFACRKIWGPFNLCVHVRRFGGIIHDLWWCVFSGLQKNAQKHAKRLGTLKKLSKTQGSSLMLPMLFRRASIFDHTSCTQYVCSSWYCVKY